MKRVNIRESFVGEPSPGQEFLNRSLGALGAETKDDEGSEALMLAVRGGELTIVIPAGLSDERAVEDAETIRGVLHLENERVVTFEIQAGATGAFYDDEPADLHRRRSADGSGGLSGITSGHDYMAGAAARSGTLETEGAATAGGPRVARDIMTSDPVTAKPAFTIQQAAELLVYHRISGLPVLDGRGKLTGIVSEADLIGKTGKTVKDVMTKEPVTVTGDDTLEHVAATMAQHKIKRVPVMDGKSLAGIISRADIVRWVATR
jgi:CBS domain-containing protein